MNSNREKSRSLTDLQGPGHSGELGASGDGSRHERANSVRVTGHYRATCIFYGSLRDEPVSAHRALIVRDLGAVDPGVKRT